MTQNIKCSTSSKENSEKKGHTYRQWATAVIANVFTITYGLQIGWLSSVLALLQSQHSPTGRPLTDAEISLIASLPPLVSAFSASPYSWLVDRYGRRFGIMTIGIVQAIAWVLCFPASPTCIIVSRVFSGIGAGGCYSIVPMFVKEISQDNMRGILGFITMLGQNIGVLVIYGLAAYVDYYVVLWITTVIPVVNAVAMLRAPESPVYLVKVGKSEPILILMSLVSVVSFAGLGVVIILQEQLVSLPIWLPVFLLVMGVFGFAAGVSPLPFIILSEIFNFQIRAKMMGILAGTAWFMTVVQCVIFTPISNTFGTHWVFFVFAAVNFFGIIVTLLLPETKGKNIEQIENALVGNKNGEPYS